MFLLQFSQPWHESDRHTPFLFVCAPFQPSLLLLFFKAEGCNRCPGKTCRAITSSSRLHLFGFLAMPSSNWYKVRSVVSMVSENPAVGSNTNKNRLLLIVPADDGWSSASRIISPSSQSHSGDIGSCSSSTIG